MYCRLVVTIDTNTIEQRRGLKQDKATSHVNVA